MPNWSHQLPSDDNHYQIKLVRTPPDRPLRALITCHRLFLCPTHYWGGRTMPCEYPECPACDAGAPIRRHVYLSALLSKSHQPIIFECTALAAVPFEDWYTAHKTLRGCLFTALRPKRQKNAKVEITTAAIDLTKITLPDEPDIPKIMAQIWQLPAQGITEAASDTAARPIANAHRFRIAAEENELYAPPLPASSNGRKQ